MRHIKGEMKRLEIPKNMTIDDFCKQIIENEFMDKVYDEYSSLEELMEETFDECEGYGEALNYLDYHSDKYFVEINPNSGEYENVWEVVNKEEEDEKEKPSIKVSVDDKEGIMKFDVRFNDEDDDVCIYCLENALNGDYVEYWDGEVVEDN